MNGVCEVAVAMSAAQNKLQSNLELNPEPA